MRISRSYSTPQTSDFSKYQNHFDKYYNVNLIREKAYGLWPRVIPPKVGYDFADMLVEASQ